MSDDVSDDDSIDDETDCDGACVESRENDSDNAEDATWDDYCCNGADASVNRFHWKGQYEVGVT
jgi:hypothetical protein